MKVPIIGIVGPTAVGKSELALEMARGLDAEIISVDAMQVYRGMDIGTGKPSAAVRNEIPHQGLDLVNPEEDFSVARYLDLMLPVLQRIHQAGRRMILVGGTGLYLHRLIFGLCAAPAEHPEVRERLMLEGKRLGSPALHARLENLDPEAAVKIHPNNLKRLVRALEVYQVSGRPISAWQKETTSQSFLKMGSIHLIGLTCDRALLRRRINQRTEHWLASGWLEESEGLLKGGLSRTARTALGYSELFELLQNRRSLAEATRQIQLKTAQYAKRQWTWFRKEPNVRWLDTDGKNPSEFSQELLSELSPASLPA